jgi:hypothetical protein
VCFDFLYNFCLKHFSFYEEFSEILLQMCVGLHVKCPLYFSDFIGICIFFTDFLQFSDTKFDENPSSWSRVFPCRRTDNRLDDPKIFAFQNFAKAPKSNRKMIEHCIFKYFSFMRCMKVHNTKRS